MEDQHKEGSLENLEYFQALASGVRAYDPPSTGSDGTVAIAITGVEHKFEHKSCLTIGSEQLWGTLPGPRTKPSPDTRANTTNKGETTRRERKEREMQTLTA